MRVLVRNFSSVCLTPWRDESLPHWQPWSIRQMGTAVSTPRLLSRHWQRCWQSWRSVQHCWGQRTQSWENISLHLHKNPPASAGEARQELQWVRSLGLEDLLREGNGNPLQSSYLENSLDRGALQATGHRVAKSQTQLSEGAQHIQGEEEGNQRSGITLGYKTKEYRQHLTQTGDKSWEKNN